MWLTYAGEVEGAGRGEDALAFLRDQHQFRNVQLVELPNGDFAATMARQFYFDHAHLLLLRALTKSADARVAEIAAKAAREVAYHVERSADWVIRLGDGTEESHARMQKALDRLWPYTGEMFAADDVELALVEAGVAADPRALRDPWLAAVDAVLARSDARAARGRMDAGRAPRRRQAGRAYRAPRASPFGDAVPAARVPGGAVVSVAARRAGRRLGGTRSRACPIRRSRPSRSSSSASCATCRSRTVACASRSRRRTRDVPATEVIADDDPRAARGRSVSRTSSS